MTEESLIVIAVVIFLVLHLLILFEMGSISDKLRKLAEYIQWLKEEKEKRKDFTLEGYEEGNNEEHK